MIFLVKRDYVFFLCLKRLIDFFFLLLDFYIILDFYLILDFGLPLDLCLLLDYCLLHTILHYKNS